VAESFASRRRRNPMTSDDRSPITGRILLLASAGSGKTYRLSSQLIGLLAAGVPPGEILASTFTRKAAGEITDRILERLAEGVTSAAKSAELRDSMPAGVPPGSVSDEAWGPLLVATVRGLHRLQIQTLDAFFHRVVRVYEHELGLPEGWGIARDPDRDRLRSMAVEGALDELDQGVMVEMVRLSGRGGADRAVHRLLTEATASLHRIYRELDPSVPAPWGFAGGVSNFPPVPDDEFEEAVGKLVEVELPLTKAGTENANWVRARATAVNALRRRDWEGFFEKGFSPAILQGRDTFSRCGIPDEMVALHEVFFRAARAELGPDYHRRMAALGRFLPEYDARIRDLARTERLYDFESLTWALSEGGGLGRGEELYYRLDGRIRHVLLDEFQDTSTSQWAALEPLAGEILSGSEDDRAIFIVADPKQSIYGWRGGEPGILDHIMERYGVEPGSMSDNWRSSQVVLDTVNRVFEDFVESPVLADAKATAMRWQEAFDHHTARRDLPGHVRLEVGPYDRTAGNSRFRPMLLSRAADLVKTLHREAPGATIGVLTRTNRDAAYIMATLRHGGIEASEEGGVPIADSSAVLSVLALLRVADHPGDRISAYLAAKTPSGRLVGLGTDDWDRLSRVEAVATEIRQALLDRGYGAVVTEWVRRLRPEASTRDRIRLGQLGELAFRWDERATLRPMDFVRFVETSKAEDPAASAVRVMTIHAAKGLEFDAVVLPSLDSIRPGEASRDTYFPLRQGGAGPVTRVFPAIPSKYRALFPEVDGAVDQARERHVRDSLSALYVALTRARHALHILVPPVNPGSSGTGSAATLVTDALAPGDEDLEVPGTILHEHGDPRWWKDSRLKGTRLRPLTVARPGVARGDTVQVAPAARGRMLPRRAPSDLEGGGRVSLGRILRPPRGRGLQVGSVVHAWLEAIEWIEDGIPDRDTLLTLAGTVAPEFGDPEDLVTRFAGWIEQPDVRAALSKEGLPAGASAEREVPFVVRDGSRLLQGIADRVVRIPDEGGERLRIIDWKTDLVDPDAPGGLSERADFYLPQLEAYAKAFARIHRLPPERVEAQLVFLQAGRVIPLHPSSDGPLRDPPDPTRDARPGSQSP
jgi:ATP-dependent helicase/nuclease subunit A